MTDRGLPDFTDPGALGLGSPAPQQGSEEIDAATVSCDDGWVVEVRLLAVPEEGEGTLVGIAVHTTQPVLGDALETAQRKLEQLVSDEVFPQPPEDVEFEMTPMPMGEARDGDGNPLQLADHDHDH